MNEKLLKHLVIDEKKFQLRSDPIMLYPRKTMIDHTKKYFARQKIVIRATFGPSETELSFISIEHFFLLLINLSLGLGLKKKRENLSLLVYSR